MAFLRLKQPLGERHSAWAALAAATLTLATFLVHGYRFGNFWPLSNDLSFILKYQGELRGDWHTSLPPAHWAFTNLYGLLPSFALDDAVLAAWIGSLFLLWLGFVLLTRCLGSGWLTAVSAGVVAAPTVFAGVGSSQQVFAFFYPNQLAFGLSALGFAAVLRSAPLAAGLAFGMATLFHPGLGVLATVAALPALLAAPRASTSLAGRAAAGYLPIAAASLVRGADRPGRWEWPLPP